MTAGNLIANNGSDDGNPDHAGERGGGIYVASSGHLAPIRISLNRIQNNWVKGEPTGSLIPGGGAGIYVEGATVQIYGNTIQANGFINSLPDLDGEGGGIAIWAGDDDTFTSDATLCRNTISSNLGKVGSGLWVLVGATSSFVPPDVGLPNRFNETTINFVDGRLETLHIEDNDITDNEAWEASGGVGPEKVRHAGGGIAIIYEMAPDNDTTAEVYVLNNRVRGNWANAPSLSGDNPGVVGGGMYVSHRPRFGLGSAFRFEGNLLSENAAVAGGGLGLLAWDDGGVSTPALACGDRARSEWFNNSIVDNLVNTVTGATTNGAGLFSIPYFYGPMDERGPSYDARGNAMWNPLPVGAGTTEWYVECNPFLGTCSEAGGEWQYSILEDRFGPPSGPNCVGQEFNIFGSFSSDVPPQLTTGTAVRAHVVEFETSPCVDSSHPDLELGLLTISRDNEGDLRLLDAPFVGVATSLDIGSDELNLERFRRGDTNGDDSVDVGDVSFLLQVLFGSNVLYCEDAGDTNDDSGVDIADPSYLLNWLFVSGSPPPPPPYPDCGLDGTADALLPCLEGIPQCQ